MALTRQEKQQLRTAIHEDLPEKLRNDGELLEEKYFDLIQLSGSQRTAELTRLVSQRRDRLTTLLTGIDAEVVKQKAAIQAEIDGLTTLLNSLSQP